MKKIFFVVSALCALLLLASCSGSGSDSAAVASASLIGDKQTVSWDTTTGKAAETVLTVKFSNVNYKAELISNSTTSSAQIAGYFTSSSGSTLSGKGMTFKAENGDSSETTTLHTLKITITDPGASGTTALTSVITGDYSLTIPASFLEGEGTTVSEKGITIKDAVSFNLTLPATITSNASSSEPDIKFDSTTQWEAGKNSLTLTLDNCTSTLSGNEATTFSGFNFAVSGSITTFSNISCTAMLLLSNFASKLPTSFVRAC